MVPAALSAAETAEGDWVCLECEELDDVLSWMTALVRLLAVVAVALTIAGSAEAARVPAGVTSVRIRSATGITTTVICRSCVRRIVQAFDALPRFVARPCPYVRYTPPDVRFEFLTADGTVVLRALDHVPGTCGGSITYGTEGPLKSAALADCKFVALVSAIAGDIDPNARTAANERLALRDAAHLVRLTVAPPGSRRLSTTPKELATSGRQLTASHIHDRIWKVPMSVGAVYAFEHAHRPRGSTITFQDRTNNRRGQLVLRRLGFSFPAIRNRVWTRDVTVSIAPLGHGWTGIRVGAWDDWVLAHDPDEVVPGGVRTIEIRKNSRLLHRVTSARQIRTVIRWLDALPVAPAAGPCSPPWTPAVERITFLAGSGRVLARAKGLGPPLTSSECYPIDFSVGSRSFPPLLGGKFFVRVERLLR